MELVQITKRKKASKRISFFLSISFMFIAACCISFNAKSKLEKSDSLFSRLMNNLISSVSIQAVRACYPIAAYKQLPEMDQNAGRSWIAAAFLEQFPINQYKIEFAYANIISDTDQAVFYEPDDEDEDNLIIVDNDLASHVQEENGSLGTIGVLNGDSYYEEIAANEVESTIELTNKLEQNKKLIQTLKQDLTTEFLTKNFYIVDGKTTIDNKIFNAKQLLEKNFKMEKDTDNPQILIYHTHGGSEAFTDSHEGKIEETVVGVGTELANVLANTYGYNVIHDKTQYDIIDGSIDRNKSYTVALSALKKTLARYPSIEVVIDIHRDSSLNKGKTITTVDGKPTAQIMFFNGLSRNQKGDIEYLKNPNLQANLAFSLQLKIKAMEQYPNLTKPIYLKNYRYNLHLREKSLLIELGTDANTLQEAKNAMTPLAEVLNQVLNE
ncbi:stage II sporulation protein P [Anaeromicropila populeti]|uniref:Stage II sporulation protein P (SpoIIP) n=1 Tax=Anaeromicropila populeti TaxID=37658 RepID=A0A1I6IPT0_9FIRM|nr:stage II sporulation protein P [Anaeromicropila populeti]SFR68728.1 Stage II sporulation protein P (SpoIIP) [Anaeromicropila populeti]